MPSSNVPTSLDPLETPVPDAPLDALAQPPPDAEGLEWTFRTNSWRPQRKAVYRAMQALNLNFHRRQAFATCGTSYWLLESKTRPGVFKLARDYCHDRWCASCAALRADTIAQRLRTALADRPARLITLTVRSDDTPLHQQLQHLYASFRRLRRLPIWTTRIFGGCAILEITYNANTDRFHPHLHCITQGRFLPQDTLADEWERCTGDSRIVDVRYISNHAHAATYVTKYVTKPIDASAYHTPARLQEAITALKGTKQVITFGTWRKLKLTQPLNDDDWTSYGHWHELLANSAERHTELINAILRSPNRAAQGEWTLEDLEACTPQERPP